MTCACHVQITDSSGPSNVEKGQLDETYLPISTKPYNALGEEPRIPAMLDESLRTQTRSNSRKGLSTVLCRY